MAGTGTTPPILICRTSNAGGAIPSPSPYASGIPIPFAQNLARPRAMFMEASVTINACSFSLVIQRPLKSPNRPPITRLKRTAGTNPSPLFTIRYAQPVEINPTTEPTERSISPRIRIMVIPIAIIPFSDTALRTFIRLRRSKKLFLPSFTQTTDATTNIITRAMTLCICLSIAFIFTLFSIVHPPYLVAL